MRRKAYYEKSESIAQQVMDLLDYGLIMQAILEGKAISFFYEKDDTKIGYFNFFPLNIYYSDRSQVWGTHNGEKKAFRADKISEVRIE